MTTVIPDSPYKGLAAFEDSELDALLFFGRERDVGAVAANVLASRLTVLYGPSGVGKSSLLGAGVARRLRELSGAPVVVHGSWAEDPAGGLAASVRAECGELGPTAGLVDTVAAAAQQSGELYLLLDQFEEYLLYHGSDGPLTKALPELLRRPGLRVNILLAIRDDVLSELDEFTGRIPELFANLVRLDHLDREAGRAAIVGPLERYSELSGERYIAEAALVEALLDEAATDAGVEAPYLQLVLERLWERERGAGSRELRLATLGEIGGARAIVHEHVERAFEGLPSADQEAAARVLHQLVTPSGRKVSHEAGDLAEYAKVEPAQLQELLEQLGRSRIVRGVNGTPGAPTRYEIFHDVLGPPILAWQHEHQLRSEREQARKQRRRLRVLVGAAVAALLVVGAIATYALVQRSQARTQAQHARGRELASQALAELPINPQTSVQLALGATELAPGRETAGVLRSSLLAMREERIIRLGGTIVYAGFAPRGGKLLVASSNGKLAVFDPKTARFAYLDGQAPLTTAAWSPNGEAFATGSTTGDVVIWGSDSSRKEIHLGSSITSLAFAGKTLLIASGADVRLADAVTGKVRTFAFQGLVEAAALDPTGTVFAVAFRHGPSTSAELVNARTGRPIRLLPEQGIRSFAFSPKGRLVVSGSIDLTARIWNARTGRQLHVLRHKGYVVDEQFSRDGKTLVTSSTDGAAYTWDVATGERELLLVGSNGAITAAAFSPDGSEIATASADRLARIYDSQGGRLLAPLAGHANAVRSVGFDPSGRFVVTGSSDGTARLWDAQPIGTLTTIDKRTSPVRSFWLGNNAVSVAGNEARILTTAGRLVKTLKMPTTVVAAAAAGNNMALADSAGDVLIDRPGPHGIAVVRNAHVTTVALETSGAVWLGSPHGTVTCWACKLVLHVGSSVLGLSTGGGHLLVRLADEVRIYNTENGTLVSTIHSSTDRATLSPDGLGVATTSGKIALLWDASTGRLLHTLKGHQSSITDIEYSPNSLDVLAVSYDRTGLIWSARSGHLIRRLIGHFFPVYAGSYSPDGHWIVTASQFTAGLWDVGTGQLMFEMGRHNAPLTGAAFSPSGDWILTGSRDGTARTYDCEVCEPLPRLEKLAARRLRTSSH
jgi:WD40 repeat protein